MMSTHSPLTTQPFNFDEWLALAKSDPEAFEQRRKAVIETYLSGLPPSKQRRMRGLQFRIDMERRRAHTAMGACIKLSSMMWDALVGPGGLTASIQLLSTSQSLPTTIKKTRSAQILSFRK